jgi:hypothetical protein
MSKDAKPRKGDEDKLARIHLVLNEYDGEEALRRIREVLYGPPPSHSNDEIEEDEDADV